MARFYISSLGCKVNTYEIEAIKDSLIKCNYEHVLIVEEADYIIINTCCVTNTAQSKSRQKINHLHKLNPLAKIIVMGCYIQGFEEEAKQIEGVSLLVGTKDRHKIKNFINSLENEQISIVENVKNNYLYENLTINSYSENTRAFLKIQDGCNNFCSYCIIPYVRGIIKSRKEENILEEVERLLKEGYKELVLTGIHTGSYGKDLNDKNLSQLISVLIGYNDLYRLRISSIEESEIDDLLIELMINNKKIARHLHIPLQAGSNHILQLMNRKYDSDKFIYRVKEIQKKIPDIAITTDIIVGFPKESEQDFLNTIKVCRELGFSKIHVFPYSARNNTPAAKMSGQINGTIKKNRVQQLTRLSDELGETYNRKFINTNMEILVEEVYPNYVIGHSSNFIKVKCNIDNKIISNNDIIVVKIIKAFSNYVEAIMEEKR